MRPIARIAFVGSGVPNLLSQPARMKQISPVNPRATDSERMPVIVTLLVPVAESDAQFVCRFAALHHLHFISAKFLQQLHHGNHGRFTDADPRGPGGSMTVMEFSDDLITRDIKAAVIHPDVPPQQSQYVFLTLQFCHSSMTNSIILLSAESVDGLCLQLTWCGCEAFRRTSPNFHECGHIQHTMLLVESEIDRAVISQALLGRGLSRSSCHPNSRTYAAFSPRHCREPQTSRNTHW